MCCLCAYFQYYFNGKDWKFEKKCRFLQNDNTELE